MTEQTRESEATDEETFGLDDQTVDQVLGAVRSGDAAALAKLIDPLHAADVADILEQIDPSTRRDFVQLWGGGIDGDILSELDEGLREEVIDALAPDELADAVRDLESDDVVDLLEDLEKPQQDAILDALDDSDRVAAERALSYPEESAGRLMQREVVMGPEHWNVGQAIDFLRNSKELPEQFYHMILVDPRMRPVGYVTLGKLLSAPRKTPLVDLIEESFRTFPATAPEEDVAYAFNQYHLISAPVTDEDDRLVGVITIDDAMNVLDEEHEEDILRLAGVGEESLSDRIWETAKSRAPWLTVNLGTAILASAVIAQFEDAIAQIVALAVLMPIIASMGGNAGTQSLTVAVRALATKDLTSRNSWRILRREALAGLINGLLFAFLMGLVGYFWYGSGALGMVLAAAMVINLVVAGIVGVGVPVVLDKIGIDPALASGTFVTTVTDVAGFLAFLGLASAFLL
ncbi:MULTISPECIES: magnesium transporter [Halocynthiibacter]|uniref:Magnesium transporter MgtE n=1 Tax=Halocynthiibacter halioticoli TaxID=2986804 RepID=A0AAE3IX52_9RHOB|nr:MULTISPECIES: magnesium transporter [Halocynthiibacter]MCV6823765.1 magnesium transporter [Halocynthiibacter halioticoli]MCW4056766.1 magnesium transporter [Halocynthiibacter sp. SDUM655004]MDE0590216.1 magnesium transporter [Halocynthiibacter sp. C4]